MKKATGAFVIVSAVVVTPALSHHDSKTGHHAGGRHHHYHRPSIRECDAVRAPFNSIGARTKGPVEAGRSRPVVQPARAMTIKRGRQEMAALLHRSFNFGR